MVMVENKEAIKEIKTTEYVFIQSLIWWEIIAIDPSAQESYALFPWDTICVDCF